MSTTQGGEYEIFANGETLQVQGATANTGVVLQTARSTDGTSIVKLQNIAGTINQNDVLEGATTGATGTAGIPTTRFLLNVSLGAFATGDWFFSKASNTEGFIDNYSNKSGSLTGNTGGRITIDVETIDAQWVPGDVIYGSVT